VFGFVYDAFLFKLTLFACEVGVFSFDTFYVFHLCAFFIFVFYCRRNKVKVLALCVVLVFIILCCFGCSVD